MSDLDLFRERCLEFLGRGATKRAADLEDQRQARLASMRRDVESSPQRLDGPALKAAVDATAAPQYVMPKVLVGNDAYFEILKNQGIL